MARIFVAMSGGVDSSVAAALLASQGHDVTGVTMRLLDADSPVDGCCSLDGARAAKRVCDALGVAHYTLDFAREFARDVIETYCDEYAAGRTPNPCIACNDRVKFSELMRRVALQDAEFLATGHYARIVRDDAGVAWLARGLDTSKDQSYFLYRMTEAQLEHTLFPLGELTKPQVRELARQFALPTAERPESQETCFVPDGNVRDFVRERRPDAFIPGDIVDETGAVVGRHEGVAGITVGQRRGLGLPGGERRFVTCVDTEANAIRIGPRANLAATHIVAEDVVWREPSGVAAVTVRARYRGPEPAAVATVSENGELSVDTEEPIDAPAPGQAIVCYVGDRVVGGGVIRGSA